MKQLILVAAFFILASPPVIGQTKETPAFPSYPAKVEAVRAKAINFRSHRSARMFRTRLRESLKNGVNFAGHYIISMWGCGTGCLSGAVIDARNGNVYFPAELNVGIGYVDDDEEHPVNFKKDSRLLTITGQPGLDGESEISKPEGKYFFEWKNDRFRQVKFIERKPVQDAEQ